MYSRNVELAGHILALKTISLVVYPTYAEYVNFCMGFMIVDLPWLNRLLPESFNNFFDTVPMGYLFYFANMNLAAMHFFTSIFFLLFSVVAFCLCSGKKEKTEDVNLDEGKFWSTIVMRDLRSFSSTFLLSGSHLRVFHQ